MRQLPYILKLNRVGVESLQFLVVMYVNIFEIESNANKNHMIIIF